MTDKEMIIRKLKEKREKIWNKIKNEKDDFIKVGLRNDLDEIDVKIFDMEDKK